MVEAPLRPWMCSSVREPPKLTVAESRLGMSNTPGRGVTAMTRDAGVAELPEIGQVFAHLGVGEAQGIAQLLGTEGLPALVGERLQFAQVEAQPLDGGAGYAL